MSSGIKNEWGAIQRVVVGTAEDMGGTPALGACYDPVSRQHVLRGDFPNETDVQHELEALSTALVEAGAEVIRPQALDNLNQVFARDVGMVVDNVLLRARMIEDRALEWEGVAQVLGDFDTETLPDGVKMEGGDLLVLDGALAVGFTHDSELSSLKVARTNSAAVDFLGTRFPHRKVLPIELAKSDTDPLANTLHLDCAFMPLGCGHAIVHKAAFLKSDQLNSLLQAHGQSGVLEVDATEAMLLQTNLFHVNPTTVLSDARFTRVNAQLKAWGYSVLTLELEHIGRMGGLLRCSTLPLARS